MLFQINVVLGLFFFNKRGMKKKMQCVDEKLAENTEQKDVI